MSEEKRIILLKTIDVIDKLIENLDELSSGLKKTFKEHDGVYVVDDEGNCVLEEEKEDKE